MTYDKYTILLKTHVNEYESKLNALRNENYQLNKKIDYLNELLSCYRSRISDLEDMLEGDDYE